MAALQQAMIASAGGSSDPYTKLLLHFGGANGSTTFTDSSPTPKVPSSVVGCTITTAQSKFGGSGGVCSAAAGSHVDYSGEADFAFGTGDWTIDFWTAYSGGVTPVLIDFRPTSGNGFYPMIYANGTFPNAVLTYYVNATVAITGPATFPTGWRHIAVARSGTSTKMFLDGAQVGATLSDSGNYLVGASRPRLFANGNNQANEYNGYIDELRISKGIARWTANFTPPTAPY